MRCSKMAAKPYMARKYVLLDFINPIIKISLNDVISYYSVYSFRLFNSNG